MARITKDPLERKKEIIDTAELLFIANGYEQTTIIDIAKKMNVASGLIYHYFDSKLELMETIIGEKIITDISKIETIINSNGRNARESLELCLNYGFEMMNSRKELFKDSEITKLKKLLFKNREVIESIHQKMLSVIYPAVLKLIKQGNQEKIFDVDYPEQTAILLIHGLGSMVVCEPKVEYSKEIFENLVKRVLKIK